MKISEIWQRLLLLIYPKHITCNGCGRELKEHNKLSLCPSCFAQLNVVNKQETYSGLTIFSCYEYNLLSRKMVIAYKDGNKPYLSEYMAKAMADLFLDSGISCDAVCFVPSDKHSTRKRGFDAMKNVAKFFVAFSGTQLLQQITRIKHSKDQTELNVEQRKRFVLDNFVVKEGAYFGKNVLILDDLVASGATLNECARVLIQNGGAKTVVGITFAKSV